MKSLWLLTKKNIQLLIRAKSSALIIVFAPLLLILIMGLSFNSSDNYSIRIGVQAHTFTNDTNDINEFISVLENENFIITKYEGNTYPGEPVPCIEDLKLSIVHTCITLPDTFKIEGNTPKEITFYIDPSRINLVGVVQETLKNKLNLKSQEISEELTTEILTKLTDTQSKITTEKAKIPAIKEKSSSASSESSTIKAGLAALDFTAPTISYDSNISEVFKQDILSRASVSISKINDAKLLVANINITAVNDSNSTNETESSTIEALLNEADAAITGITTELSAGNNSFTEINTLITTLKADIETTKGKLTSASNTISGTSVSLDKINSVLSESISSLDGLDQALSEINTNLASQQTTEAGIITTPLITNIEKVSESKTRLDYIFPPLLVLVVMFASLLLGTTLVMMEKTSPAFVRNFFLPVKKVTFIMSTYLTNLVLIIIQLAIIMGISLVFMPEAYPSFPLTAIVLFLASSVFTFLGMAIGYLFASEETATLASISLGSLLLFVSGVILPIESMSPLFREVMAFSPFTIAEKLVREVFIFHSVFTAIWVDFLILAGYAVVLFLIILIIESLLHEQLKNKFMKHYHKKHRAMQTEKRGV